MIERYTPHDIGDIWTEKSKFQRFLTIELLVCDALARTGVIPKKAAASIRKKARISVPKIKKLEEKTHHDIVAFVLNLSESLGQDAQYIHWGLTSSDLLDTTLAWQLSDASKLILKSLDILITQVKKKAQKFKDTICVARTHGVHAEVYSFGLKFAFFYDELVRVRRLIDQAQKFVCCGKISGSAGNFAYLDPSVEEYVCKKIGIGYAAISSQIVSRDRIAYYMSLLALLASVIERFGTEIRHLQKTETAEAQEPFYKGQKGSSSMPHKRNPIICERMAGLARLVRGNMTVSFENINLWHERDISHSSCERVILPDSTITAVYMLRKFIPVIKDLVVYPDTMLRNFEKSQGMLFSQKVLLALMEKGMTRSVAYDIVQETAFATLKQKTTYKQELLKNKKVLQYLSARDIARIFQPYVYMRHVSAIYKRLGIT